MFGENPELITNKENGFLVEYNNQDQLAEAIKLVLDMDTGERERIVAHAQKTAEQFSATRMLSETARSLVLL